MKKLLGFLILAFCAAQIQAQTVTGQIIANQYDYLIQGYAANTYQFSGSSCNASGPSGQFAFYVGAPVRIVDGSPTLSETVTPTNVTNTNQTCAISIAPVNNHQLPWHLESGSGGLQEAINLNLSQPATNTIILDNAWYQKLASIGTNAAAVIAAAHGTTNLSLQDVTQAPNTYYTWNGSQYVETTISGQSLATYSVPGLQGGGRCFVYPSSISTDAFAAFNACAASLPSTGGVIDAMALGTANYTVTTPLTGLNISGKRIALLLNRRTTFTVNVAYSGTLSNSPSFAAIAVGDGSAMIFQGTQASDQPNINVGSSARVWDVVSNGNFGGLQESLLLDGVTIEGNASATVSGALLHLQGLFLGTRISNSSTYACFAQCLEVDAGNGSPGFLSSDLLFDSDDFQDSPNSATYPGSVVKIDAISSSGAILNITFLGGAIQFNGPHNPLLVINGRGGPQTNTVNLLGTDIETSAATPSIYNSNVDPIQIIDASQVLSLDQHVTGTTNPATQPNLIDITATVQNISYGITFQSIEVEAAQGFTCIIKNNVEGTCESGFTTGAGSTVLPPYTFGQVAPQVRQTNVPAPTSVGVCVVGNVWTNSTDVTAGAFKVCQGAPGSQVYTTIGGSGTTSFQVAGTPLISGTTVNFVPGANITITNPSAGNITISAPSPGAATFPALGGGTNTGSAFVCGSGCSFGTAGSGTNAATSVPYSGVSGVPTAASGTLGVSSPDNVTIAATTGVYHIVSPGASTILGFSSANGYIGYTAGTNISLAGGQISNTSTANTVSGTLTPTCITLATGAHSIGCANATDNGTQFSITEALNVGGTGPGLATPTAANVSSNPLPACNSGSVNTLAVVSDLNTTPTFWLAYAGNSGGTKTAPVVCAFDGSAYAWRVH